MGTVGREGPDILTISTQFLMSVALLAALPLGLVFLAGLVSGVVQHQPIFSTEPLMPQWSRLSPAQGFERIFGRRARLHAAKGFVRVFALGAALFFALWPLRDFLAGTTGMAAPLLPSLIQDLLLRVLLAALILYAAFAVLDYLHEWYEWKQRLRMTREDAKQERKSDEGHPEIKARMRRIGTQRVRKRMMAAVPQATVVIANPTHFAVALRYENGMDAPVCIAKGLDHLALRIRALAEDNRVPVIENPPLARALYASVDLDQPIPVEHYRAVAEVIGFVLRLKRRGSQAHLQRDATR
ncbi:MAG: EscU/YscU/HrcU family type III secretion system export apparatus switch protein [Beijerinckiaceae bacterium]|nr:EscU/YscU/HrcU family type III secretion system export apparatus switch protein [Beijerinckiaceae bacterium]